jgi:hypothetical protein
MLFCFYVNMKRYKLAVLWFWFGQFPAHVELLFRSVAANYDIDVLLFTDNSESSICPPPNICVYNTTLDALQGRIRRALLSTARLTLPYKICDYRPAFGEIFAKELEPYDFWGWGDLDVIWGNLSEFMPAHALERCVKIFQFGALSFVRNSAEMNGLFRHDGGLDWEDVMQSVEFRGFDETYGIHAKIEKAGFYRHYDSGRADIFPYLPRFTERVSKTSKGYLYSWTNGNTYRECWADGKLSQIPVSYVHFQKRNLPIITSRLSSIDSCFWITPNGFVNRPLFPTKSDFCSVYRIGLLTYARFAKYWASRLFTRIRGTSVRKSIG